MILKKSEWINIYGDPQIGEGTEIAAFVEIGTGVVIGRNCKICAFSFIPEGVEIGDNVFVGPGTKFVNDKHAPSRGKWRAGPKTVIGDNVSIGAGAIIGAGLIIGLGARIGMGAVVTKDVDPFETVVGNPAKPMVKKQ